MQDPAEEALIATAVARGFLTPAQVQDGRRLHALLASRGQAQGLLALLVARHLRPEQASALLAGIPPAPLVVANPNANTVSQAGPAARPSGRQAAIGVGHGGQSIAPQSRFGPYVVERELARGGMGMVLIARHSELGRRVAIKVMLGRDRRHLERFRIEAQATARLRHPNIVALHEVGVEDGRPYLVMDLVEGASLADKLARGGPFEPRLAATIAEKVARALGVAHEAGILHRDIKPANILIRADDGEPVVTDFGLAKDSSEVARLTHTGQVIGTPAFMPPEQATGQLDRIGVPSDVYSLGATLYAMLCGEPPFGGDMALNILVAVVRTPPPSLRSSRPEVDAALDAICLRCLAKDPDDRYPTAAALADELQRWLDGRIPTKRGRGSLLGVLLVVGVLALAAVAGIAAFAQRPPEVVVTTPPPATTAAPPPERPGPDPAGTARLAEAERELAAIPSGPPDLRLRRASAWLTRYAGLPGEARAREVLRVAGHDAPLLTLQHDAPPDAAQEARVLWLGEARLVSWGRNHGHVRVWSVDGKEPLATFDVGTKMVLDLALRPPVAGAAREAVVLADSGPCLVRLEAGSEPRPLRVELPFCSSVACAPDGRVAVGTTDGALLVLDGVDGPARRIEGAHGSTVRCVDCSADGRWIATASGRAAARLERQDDRLVLWDARSLEQVASVRLESMPMSLAFSPDGRWLAVGTSGHRVHLLDLRAPKAELTQLVGGGTEALTGGLLSGEAHSGAVRALVFLPDGSLRSGSAFPAENGLRAWEPGAARELGERARLVPGPIVSLDVASDGRLLVGDTDGRITVWSPW